MKEIQYWRSNEPNKIRLLYFLVLSCTASWLPIFADYLKDRGLSGYEIATILSITPILAFTVQPFYGVITDKLGYKTSLIVSSLLGSASFALFLIQGGFAWLFAVTVAMSLFYSSLQPILDSLTIAAASKNQKISYGSIRIAGALGWALTGSVVGYFIESIDTRVIFVSSAATMLLTFVVASTLNAPVEGPKQTATLPRSSFVMNIQLLILLITVFLVSTGATTIWNFYSIYMKEIGAGATLVGFGLSLQGFCELPLFYFSATIIKKLGIKTALAITVLATSLRLFLYSLVDDPYLALGIEVLHGISWSLFWVVCVTYVDGLVGERWRATGQFLLYGAYFGAGAVAGNFWTGYLYEQGMKISEIFLINAVAMIGVLLIVAVFVKRMDIAKSPQSPA